MIIIYTYFDNPLELHLSNLRSKGIQDDRFWSYLIAKFKVVQHISVTKDNYVKVTFSFVYQSTH